MNDLQFLYIENELKKNKEICQKAILKCKKNGFNNLSDYIYYRTRFDDFDYFLRLLDYSKKYNEVG